jgi:hypothetical protein
LTVSRETFHRSPELSSSSCATSADSFRIAGNRMKAGHCPTAAASKATSISAGERTVSAATRTMLARFAND